MELEFDNWYDIFADKMKAHGWIGNIDKDSARMDYDNGLSPEDAAYSLYVSLTEE